MKKILLFLLTFCAMAAVFSQSVQNLKSRVCVVREVYFDETKVYCGELQDLLNRSGYPSYSEYVENYIGHTFGSGFVYVAPNGNNYVVTNRHVVSKGEGATVEFENADGTFQKYENLRVVAMDDNLDIAVLEFANGAKPFKTGLTFAASPAVDGEDVWSAGFPGLNGEPVWQFGRGNITNASIKIKEFLDPEISTLIQHSAPIDSGNSGGPLLRQKNGSYEIVGVNTWKFFYRQSTNISIPAAVIQKFLNETLAKSSSSDTVENLNLRVEELKKLFDSDEVYFRDLSKFISFDYVKSAGGKSFIQNMKKATSNDRNAIRDAFVSYSPIEGLSYSVALDVYSILKEDDFIKDSDYEEPVKKDDGNYYVKIKNDNKTVDTVWIYESVGLTGNWRLVSCEVESVEKTKSKKSKSTSKDKTSSSSKSSSAGAKSSSKSDVEIETPYKLFISAGAIPNADSSSGAIAFGGTFGYKAFDYLGLQVSAGSQKIPVGSAFFAVGSVLLEVPVKINDFAVIPYATGGFEYMKKAFSVFTGFEMEIGAKVGYSFDTIFPYAYVAFNLQRLNGFFDKDVHFKRAGVSFGVGIGFDL